MKVAVAQFNPVIGAVQQNKARMLEWIARARSQGASVVLFPELCVPGYPPRDLLDRPGFVKRVLGANQELIASAPADMVVIFGSVGRAAVGPGLPLTNDAIVASAGRELARAQKRLLPTYDVFDEARHFRPGRESANVSILGRRVAITICEDAWAESSELAGRYADNPLDRLDARAADVIFNLSASPFTLWKWERREAIFRDVAIRHGVCFVVANQVGANDELIFDGSSAAWSASGQLLAHAVSFEEDLLLVDVPEPAAKTEPRAGAARATGSAGVVSPQRGSGASQPRPGSIAAAYSALVLGVRDYARKCGFQNAMLGASGGIDSALTAAIAVDALGPDNVMTFALPTRYSSPGSLTDAAALAKNLGVAHRVIDIDPMFQAYVEQLGPVLDALSAAGPADVTLENIQARVRGATLMAISNRTGALVLTTGNKSELAVGYCTLYGDMVGGLAVISDVPKTMVYQLAHYVNREGERIPRSSIEKPPSAELRPDQTDQDSLPPYAELDPILEAYVEDHLSPTEIAARGHDAALVERVVSMVRRAEYKRRQAAPGLILTRKAFGLGRRMPVAADVQEASAVEVPL